MPAKAGDSFRLGRWRVFPSLVQLRDAGETVRLEPKVMDLLDFLARHPRRVVSKDEIIDAVWPDTVIADDALHRYVSKLRQYLGDNPRKPTYLETIPKRGYRLIAPISFDEAAGAGGEGSAEVAPAPGHRPGDHPVLRRLLPWGVAALAIGIALASHFRKGTVVPDPAVPPSERVVAQSNDPRAYELYLQSLAHARDGGPNQRAIRMLEQVVELDPGFAPAWDSLAERLYYEGAYQIGGEPALSAALAASRRAAELDPELLNAAMVQTLMQAERGELRQGYDAARAMLEEYPHRAESHFAASYIYRYAGLLEEAARECDVALSIAPDNYRFRSCAVVFIRLGHYQRAMDFIRLDQTSELGLYHQGYLYIHQVRIEDAERAWRRLSEDSWAFGLLEACRDRPESPETQAHLERFRTVLVPDPEARYFVALVLNACGDAAAALHLLEEGAERGYCAVSAFGSRFFANLTVLEGWAEARDRAASCRDTFIAYQDRHPAAQWPGFPAVPLSQNAAPAPPSGVNRSRD